MTDDIFKKLDEAGPDEIESHADPIMQQLIQQAQSQQEPTQQVGTVTDQILKGATYGHSDELGGFGIASTRALGGDTNFVENYKMGRDDIRAKNKAYEEQNFWPALGYQMIGGAPISMATGGKFLKTPMAQGMANPTKNAIMGGAGGAVAGLGLSEEDHGLNTLAGLATGTILGPTVPYAMNKLAGGMGYIGNTIRDAFSKPTNRAHRLMKNYLKDAGIHSQDDLNRAVKDMDDPLLADASESMRDLTDATYQAKGTSDIIRPVFDERKQQVGKNIVKGLQKTTGKTGKHLQSIDEIDEVMSEKAKPLYDEAMKVDVPFTEELESIFNRKAIKRAFKKAEELADATGEMLPDLFEEIDGEMVATGKIPNMQAWQHIKKGIDAVIDKETDEITGKTSHVGRAYVILKNDLLDILDKPDMNPLYKEARKVYGGYESLKTAMKKGSKVLVTDDYLSEKDFQRMSDSDKDGYLLGAMNAIRDKVELMSINADATKRVMFQSPAMQRRLEKAFPSKKAFKEFMRIVDSEGRKAETNRVIFNSRTNKRGQMQRDMGMDTAGDIQGASSGNIFSMLRLSSNAMENMKKLPPETLTELARALTSSTNKVPSKVFGGAKMPKHMQFLVDEETKRLLNAYTKGGVIGYGSGKLTED